MSLIGLKITFTLRDIGETPTILTGIVRDKLNIPDTSFTSPSYIVEVSPGANLIIVPYDRVISIVHPITTTRPNDGSTKELPGIIPKKSQL